ncbi:MAG TPA: aldo/keto reductase [Streptosporangiaceae bacterium]|nr:aldo/keto reductase [Streptosporangiaceae bacterium]
MLGPNGAGLTKKAECISMQQKLQVAEWTASGVGLGCRSLCRLAGRPHRSNPVTLLRRAIDSGVTLIDSCAATSGQAEPLIGAAITSRDTGVMISVGAPSRSLRRACENSLRRLGLDRIGLYYVSPAASLPIEAVVGEAAELVAAGKVAHLGIRNVTAEQLRRANAVHPVAALVTEYSLLHRQVERELLPLARGLGMAVIACRPLGAGLLTGRITSAEQLAAPDPLSPDWYVPSVQRAGVMSRLSIAAAASAELDAGISRVALAWLLAQGDHVIPVPSTGDLVHLEMNLAAAAVRLSPEDLARLSARPPSPGDLSPLTADESAED